MTISTILQPNSLWKRKILLKTGQLPFMSEYYELGGLEKVLNIPISTSRVFPHNIKIHYFMRLLWGNPFGQPRIGKGSVIMYFIWRRNRNMWNHLFRVNFPGERRQGVFYVERNLGDAVEEKRCEQVFMQYYPVTLQRPAKATCQTAPVCPEKAKTHLYFWKMKRAGTRAMTDTP